MPAPISPNSARRRSGTRVVRLDSRLSIRRKTVHKSYAAARADLGSILDQVAKHRKTVIIHRPGLQDVALVSAAELSSLAESLRLLRSPNNALRLLSALQRAKKGRRP